MAGKSKSNNKKRVVKGSMRMKRRGSKVMRGGETTGDWGTAVYGGSNAQHAVPGSNVIQMNNPYAVVGQAGGDKCNMRGGDQEDPVAAKEEEENSYLPNFIGNIKQQVVDSFTPASPEVAAAPVEEAPAAPVEVVAPAEEEAPEPAAPVVGGSRKRRSAKGGKSPKKGKSAKKMRNKRR